MLEFAEADALAADWLCVEPDAEAALPELFELLAEALFEVLAALALDALPCEADALEAFDAFEFFEAVEADFAAAEPEASSLCVESSVCPSLAAWELCDDEALSRLLELDDFSLEFFALEDNELDFFALLELLEC